MFRLMFLCINILVMMNSSLFLNIHIISGSMENTISTDSYLICDKQLYKGSEPERYDIIVFQYPLDKSTLYVKRIIGLPGEHVEIEKGKIYINYSSRPISENYLKEEWTVDNDDYHFDIPEDCYLVLGDNRNNSYDVRYWEDSSENGNTIYVKKENILAKVIFQYLPNMCNVN